MCLELYWLIWNQVQWTQLDSHHMDNYLDQIILFMVNLVLVSFYQKPFFCFNLNKYYMIWFGGHYTDGITLNLLLRNRFFFSVGFLGISDSFSIEHNKIKEFQVFFFFICLLSNLMIWPCIRWKFVNIFFFLKLHLIFI